MEAKAALFTWSTAHSCLFEGLFLTISGAKPSNWISYVGWTATNWPWRWVDSSETTILLSSSMPLKSSQ